MHADFAIKTPPMADVRLCYLALLEARYRKFTAYQKKYNEGRSESRIAYQKEYRARNKDYLRVFNQKRYRREREHRIEDAKRISKKRYAALRDQILARQKKKRKEDPAFRERQRLCANKWSKEHPELRRAATSRSYYRHLEKRREYGIDYMRQYRKLHPDRIKATMQKQYLWVRSKKKTDISFRILCNLRTRLSNVMVGKSSRFKTFELLGCDRESLKRHLESLFLPGMSWENYGMHGWHIDHKRPCASFDFSKSESARECFNFRNLQPLWAVDNIRKSSKIPAL